MAGRLKWLTATMMWIVLGWLAVIGGLISILANVEQWSPVTVIGTGAIGAGLVAVLAAWRRSISERTPREDERVAAGTADADADPDKQRRFERVLQVLLEAAAVGVVALCMYATTLDSWQVSLRTTGVGVSVAGCGLLIGGLLGFLFAIPRSLQEGRTALTAVQTTSQAGGTTGQQTVQASGPAPAMAVASNTAPSGSGGATAADVAFATNTNLEQISDWLTKVLVGVGLTQLAGLPERLRDFALVLGPVMGDKPDKLGAGGWLGVALAIYFAVDGFLYGYLWTRLFGAPFLADAALDMVRSKIVQQVQATVDAQAQRDAVALGLTNRQLDLSSDVPPVAPEALRVAIAAASPDTRVSIFGTAKKARSDNWKTNKSVVERTIPIFEALIAADVTGTYDRNHGQLGYALKDTVKPNYERACTELSTAISIRNRAGSVGRYLYEYNRAVCRIYSDGAGFGSGKPSMADVKQQILSDLAVAAQLGPDEKHARPNSIFDDAPVGDWAELNKIDLNALYEGKA